MALPSLSGMAGEAPTGTAACLTLLMARCSKTRLILDKEDRIIAALVGQPDDPQWRETVDAAAGVLQEVEELGSSTNLFTEDSHHHRRGEFLAVPAGVSFGGGQTVRAQLTIISL